MRPTIEEQLNGICRVLDGTIAPLLTEPYPNYVLRGLVSNLGMLAEALSKIPPFLDWDNAGCLALLAESRASLLSPLSVEVAQELAVPAPDPLDRRALEVRNERLRDLLSRAVRSDALSGAQIDRITAHLVERAAKNPIRFAIVLPAADKNKKD